MKNLLIGLSTQNRSGKYLYYGAYNTDNIQGLLSGEIGLFWASKSAGPDAHTGVYAGGGGNDDTASSSGTDMTIGSTSNMVDNIDTFYFAQGTGNGSKAILSDLISPRNMKFKVLEYVAPQQLIQTVTLANATLVAGKYISFSAYAANAQVGAVGTAKEMLVEYLIQTNDTSTTIAAALELIIANHAFSNVNIPQDTNSNNNNRTTALPFLAATTDTHVSDIVLTFTWNPGQLGSIVSNGWSTVTTTIATTQAFITGQGVGADVAAFELETAVEKGYNPSPNAGYFWNEPFYASSSKNYHMIVITHQTTLDTDSIGSTGTPTLQYQYIAVDTTDTNDNLLNNIVSVLTDMVSKKALNPAA
jgi:hypothetical protein